MSKSQHSNSNQSYAPTYVDITTINARQQPTQQPQHNPVVGSHSQAARDSVTTRNSKAGSNQQGKGHSSSKNVDTENKVVRCFTCDELHLKGRLFCSLVSCNLKESHEEVCILRDQPKRKNIGMPYRVVKSSRFSIQEVKQNLDAIPDVQGKVEEAQRMRREEVVFHTQGKDRLCMICEENHHREQCLAVCFVARDNFGKLTFYTRIKPVQPQHLHASYDVVPNPKYSLKRMKYLSKKCTTAAQRAQFFEETTQKEREHYLMTSQPTLEIRDFRHPCVHPATLSVATTTTTTSLAGSGNSNSSSNAWDGMVSSSKTSNIELVSQEDSTSNYPVEADCTMAWGSSHSNTNDGENGISPVWTDARSGFPALGVADLKIDLNGDTDDTIFSTQSEIENWLQRLLENDIIN